jgi:hypothetical protein
MPRVPTPALVLLAAAMLGGCGSDRSDRGTAPGAASAPPADSCPTWLAEVKALCGDFVHGREVRAECARHAITLQTSFAQPEIHDPSVGPRICATQLTNLRRDQAERPAMPTVPYGDACRALATRVTSTCVDTLGQQVDSSACNARFGVIAIARAGNEEQRESACEMGLAM